MLIGVGLRLTAGLVGVLALGVCQESLAQSAEIETVFVTAEHLPLSAGHAGFSTVVLSESDLAPFDRLDAALEQVPGLSLFRRSTSLSANPTTQGISLRNIAPSAASRALVLLDGVPLNDPFGGWVIWSALPVEDIGGVSIVRGAGSGPYGSGALTGTILLSEREDYDGISSADISGGNLDTFRAAGSGGTQFGPFALFASGQAEHSNGWIPVEPDGRGPADNHTRLNAGAASLRAETDLGDGITLSARDGYYNELQGAGLVGAEAKARGETASLSLARSIEPGGIGWRLQAWSIASNLSNTSVTTAAHQASTAPANDQYATPATGYGMSAAALGEAGPLHWELGADLRDDQGESREFFNFSSALDNYLGARRSGGQSIIAGLYGEGAYDLGPWLFTLGARGDHWSTSQGHLVQSVVSTGAVALDQDYAGRGGTVPTGRAAVRRALDDGEFVRLAAYAGFRMPTLNELYRPFRVGNVVTNANPFLSPEKLDGVDIGWGGEVDSTNWSITGFWNTLHNAVENSNIALSNCPAGTGTCQQRTNVGNIDALGLEAEIEEKLCGALSLRQAVSWTDARVRPGAATPQLSGKRPAQAPAAVITSGAVWNPLEPLALESDLRWVSSQYEDDLNSIKLGSALVVDLRADWQISDGIGLFGRVGNLLNAKVATGNTTGVINTGAPRVFEMGLRYAR